MDGDHGATAEVYLREAEGGLDEREGAELRLELPTLDRIMAITGELSIARAELRALLARERAPSRGRELDAALVSDRLFEEIREQVMKLRHVPLGSIFRPQIRAVRDLAEAQGKLAQLVIEGGDVGVDVVIVEALRDPMVHMVRNALDHGIEEPWIRQAMGKDPVGTIVIRASREGARIVIEVSDDGSGLNYDEICRRARSMGFIGPRYEPTYAEIERLIFLPGLSTSASVTELSGRGAGMAIVSSNISALHGSIAVKSRPWEGMSITVRVPLSLALMGALLAARRGARGLMSLLKR